MTAYLTKTDTAFSKRLAELLKGRGFDVISGDDVTFGAVDIFIATENIRIAEDKGDIRSEIDPDTIIESYRENLFYPVKQLERLIYNLDRGQMKRICFLGSASASINMSEAIEGFGFNMAKASQNTVLQILKNKLLGDGYTFRLYDPMEGTDDDRVTAEKSVQGALTYFLTGRSYDRNNRANRDDETRLVMRDALGREWPF